MKHKTKTKKPVNLDLKLLLEEDAILKNNIAYCLHRLVQNQLNGLLWSKIYCKISCIATENLQFKLEHRLKYKDLN